MKRKYMLIMLAFIATCWLINGQTGNCEDGGILIAKGNGVITFIGTGPLSITGEGSLVVNKNASVTLPENLFTKDEPEQYIRQNAGVVYTHINGKTLIDGEDLEISFAGANIGARVNGDGTVVLKGYGIYFDSAGNAGRWSAEGTSIAIKAVKN
jgi:hypothetical protein